MDESQDISRNTWRKKIKGRNNQKNNDISSELYNNNNGIKNLMKNDNYKKIHNNNYYKTYEIFNTEKSSSNNINEINRKIGKTKNDNFNIFSDYSDSDESEEDNDGGNNYCNGERFIRKGEKKLTGKEQLKKSIREKEENEKRKKRI